MAAVEFAFVLPILLTMFLGLVELSRALALRADIVNMTSTGADLVAQAATVSGTDITNVYNALDAMIFPFDTSPETITLTSVIDGGGGTAVVAWSCSRGTGAVSETKGHAPSTPVPANVIASGGSVIWARVTYNYNSPIAYVLKGTQNWRNDFYIKPRRVTQIPITAGTTGCNT